MWTESRKFPVHPFLISELSNGYTLRFPSNILLQVSEKFIVFTQEKLQQVLFLLSVDSEHIRPLAWFGIAHLRLNAQNSSPSVRHFLAPRCRQ